MDLKTELYQRQTEHWPQEGKHILAQFNTDAVVVYQAYRPEIGLFAAEHQYFGGAFSYSRMSWIKTNFMWMMYRCGWGRKTGQEVILALYLKRDYFDDILSHAVTSRNHESIPAFEWQARMKQSDVRLQWDPDHDPSGRPLKRKAVQLGLRNRFLEPFKGKGLIKIENISEFVGAQRQVLGSGKTELLLTPRERVYPLTDELKTILNI